MRGGEYLKANREDEWRAVERMRDIHRPPVARLVKQYFDEMEAALVPQIKMIDFSSFFDFAAWKRRFLELLTEPIKRILKDGMVAGMLRAGLGALTAEQLEARNVQLDIIARQVARSELVTQHTEKDLASMLIQMVQENATQGEMQQAMRQKFQGYRDYRVDRITNTVVVSAFESGALLSWQEAGITHKSWISTFDDRVRDPHDTREHPELAVPIDINAPFVVGGAELMHPGDPNGPPGQTINCRCTMAPVFEEDL